MDIQDIKQLRMEGFLPLKYDGYFRIRISSEAGKMTGEDMEHIAYISKEYGKGYVNFTTRLCVEIPWIKYENIEKVKEEIKNFNLLLLRPRHKFPSIISCGGKICTNGIIDTKDIGEKIFNKYKNYNLPGKIKIGIIGCPNNCLKVESEDLGIVGKRIPKIIEENCTNCGLCVKSCRKNAISFSNTKLILNNSKCIDCGKCIEVCKFNGIIEEDIGVSIYVGGNILKLKDKKGRTSTLYSLEEAEKIIDRIMKYYKKHGKKKEKFNNMLDRLGMENLLKDLEGYI